MIFFRMKEVRKVKSDLLCSISVLNGTVYDGGYSGDALECIRDLSGLVYILWGEGLWIKSITTSFHLIRVGS